MFNTILLDAPIPWQIGFQEPGTPVMEGIINFHHYLFFFLVGVLIFVLHCLNNAFKKRTLITQNEQYNLSNNSLYNKLNKKLRISAFLVDNNN